MGFTLVRNRGTGSVTAFVEGLTLSVGKSHPAYARIIAALDNGDGAEAIRLSKLSERVANYIHDPNDPDGVKVIDGVLYYRKEAVNDVLTNRIVDLVKQGHDPKPVVLFFENLWQNPSFHSRNQLYNFLLHHRLPFTDDGHFIAYKRVRDNFTDFWTGTFDNSVGKHVRMDRNRVDDDWSHDCSYGLHVGSIDFVRGFHPGQGHILLVKVNPRDAVSVPQYTTTKMRVCDYDVMEECDPETLGLTESMYNTDNNSVTAVVPANLPDWTPVVKDEIVDDSDDDEDEDEEEENDDDSDWEEEDEDEEDDDSDWEDEDDEDDDDNDEDDDEALTNVPTSLLLWCESVDVSKKNFISYFNDAENANIRNAFGNKDGVGFVTHLYAAGMQRNDEKLIEALNYGENRNELVKLAQ